MNKLKFIGILLVGFALLFAGCDAIIADLSSVQKAEAAAEQAAIDDAVAQISRVVLSVYFDRTNNFLGADTPTEIVMTIDQDAETISAPLIGFAATDWSAAVASPTLKVTTANGGTVTYVNGTTIDLSDPTTITVTSADGDHTKTYDLSIDLTLPPEELSIIGTAVGGWSTDKFTLAMDSASSFTCVTALVAGEFKLRNTSLANPWDESYGADGAITTADIDGDGGNDDVPAYAIGGDNVVITTAGVYMIRIDFVKDMLFVVPVTEFGIIGDGTPGGWGAATPMTWDAGTETYSFTGALTAAGLLFRVNGNWDMALGANKLATQLAADVAGFGAGKDNLAIGVAGNGTITFNGQTLVYTHP